MSHIALRDDPALIEVIGVDGSRWTVSGEGCGAEGVELNSGPQGLQEAPRNTVWQQGSYQDGATYLGVNVEPLDLVLAFQIYGDDQDWQQRSSGFRKAFDYEREAEIRVTTESGVRSLFVRLLEAPDRNTDIDPRWGQYSLETYTLRAGVPYWAAEEEFSTVEVEAGGSGEVTISNPTDVALWPEWALSAPGQWVVPDKDFEGGQSRNITTPSLRIGQDLAINTHPREQPYVSMDGSNIAGRFGGVMFLHHVPPYTPEEKLTVQFKGLTGKGTCTLRMKRYWNSPWGGE